MDNVQDYVASRQIDELANEMHDKDYRDQYVESFSRQLLARQMRGFRGDKTQAEYGATIDKSQTQVARFEDPTYGWQTRTVFEIARKQNVAAIVCFVDFETFLRFEKSMSEAILVPSPYDANEIESAVKMGLAMTNPGTHALHSVPPTEAGEAIPRVIQPNKQSLLNESYLHIGNESVATLYVARGLQEQPGPAEIHALARNSLQSSASANDKQQGYAI